MTLTKVTSCAVVRKEPYRMTLIACDFIAYYVTSSMMDDKIKMTLSRSDAMMSYELSYEHHLAGAGWYSTPVRRTDMYCTLRYINTTHPIVQSNLIFCKIHLMNIYLQCTTVSNEKTFIYRQLP